MNLSEYRDVDNKTVVEGAFIGTILLTLLIFYLEASKISPESARLPIIIIASTVFLVAAHYLRGYVQELRGNAADDEEGVMSEFLDEEQLESPLHASEAFKVTGVMVLYVLSTIYVGFFTSIFVFIAGYIYFQDDLTGVRKVSIPLLWAGVTTTVVYLILVELLLVQSIFRLGFAP